MKYDISTETLDEAGECRHDFSCLNGAKECLCEIDYNLANGRVLFVNAEQLVHCTYMLSYGNSLICTCPVRKKIYNIYKK